MKNEQKRFEKVSITEVFGTRQFALWYCNYTSQIKNVF